MTAFNKHTNVSLEPVKRFKKLFREWTFLLISPQLKMNFCGRFQGRVFPHAKQTRAMFAACLNASVEARTTLAHVATVHKPPVHIFILGLLKLLHASPIYSLNPLLPFQTLLASFFLMLFNHALSSSYKFSITPQFVPCPYNFHA